VIRVPKWIGLAALAWAMVACTPGPAAQPGTAAPGSPPGSRPVAVHATAVPLNPEDAGQRGIGRFVYAGGVELTAADGVRFGGLSDLEILGDGRMFAVTDEGQLVLGRVVADASGRLSGLADVTMTPLTGEDGNPLRNKLHADAEGITVLPNGDRLVSFERDHRVWRYTAAGAPPLRAPAPETAGFPPNSGMEALTAFPGAQPGAYLVGSEAGMIWQCALAAGCRETRLGSRVPDGYGLTALAVSPDGSTIALVARAFDAARGVRVVVRLLGRAAVDSADAAILDEFALVAPLTRDNIEGAALVPGNGGGLRVYLLSDNNYSATQRTYLLAFDWAAR
jgi:hypothetical protein